MSFWEDFKNKTKEEVFNYIFEEILKPKISLFFCGLGVYMLSSDIFGVLLVALGVGGITAWHINNLLKRDVLIKTSTIESIELQKQLLALKNDFNCFLDIKNKLYIRKDLITIKCNLNSVYNKIKIKITHHFYNCSPIILRLILDKTKTKFSIKRLQQDKYSITDPVPNYNDFTPIFPYSSVELNTYEIELDFKNGMSIEVNSELFGNYYILENDKEKYPVSMRCVSQWKIQLVEANNSKVLDVNQESFVLLED